MIIRTLLLLLGLTFAASGFAQVTYGVYAGVSSMSLKGDAPRKFAYKPKPGPVFGATINIPIKPDVKISIQPGYAIYRPTLAYPDEEKGEFVDSLTMELDYVRLPVLLDLISDNNKWHFFGGLDPEIGVRQKATSNNEEIDMSDEITRVNLQIIFGLGRRIKIGGSILKIDLHFTQGIFNITDQLDDSSSLVPRIKTSAAELIIGYEFGKKNKMEKQ